MVNDHITELFMNGMAGGVFVYRAKEGHELLYANENLVQLFECESYGEFVEYIGNSFDGMVNETPLKLVWEDMELQISESQTDSGYVFYNIRTRKGNSRRVVNHFTRLHDESEGDIFCAILYLHRYDNVGSDFDPVTGLYGKLRFHKYVSSINQRFIEQGLKVGEENAFEDYAVIYLNLVNFKLLNIEKGAAEGDACLRMMANILREAYQDAFIARISGDHFVVFTKREGVYEKTEAASKKFCDTYGNQYDVIGKFGIYPLHFGKDFDVEAALSFAKVACDFIKHDASKDVVVYTESLAEEVKTTEYVVGKIDEALEKGWVKVYYQPVVRSLTGWLCGMESLARWDDPFIGFLPPDRFIGALERERCIYKLDSYIVEQVCQCIHERVLEKKPVVPVSVNFSRLDFIMCDMLAVVEKAVEKYDVPRDYIHIEITESMLASDEELMRDVIEGFRSAGYEIWMDDFGSGYSSLTLLKDFQFDTLKMDMRFLTPFTEKSKSVMRAIVRMAKDIGIKTLAEGVETKEQLEFLKSIGCGMIQGYYYGKPEPVESSYSHIAEQYIPVETRKWRHFYEVASFHVRETEVPLEVIEDDGTELRTLFMNQSYRDQIFDRKMESGKMELAEIDKRIYHMKSPLLRTFRNIANRLEYTGEEEVFFYTSNGNYIRFQGQCVAKNAGHSIITGSLTNITLDQKLTERERLDSKLRELHFLFESVLLLNLSEKTVTPLLREFKYIDSEENVLFTLDEGMDLVIRERIFPVERIRCYEFLDAYSLRDRVDRSGRGYISEVFRIRQFDGSYKAKEIIIMMVSGTGGNEYLCCIKPYFVKAVEGAVSRGKEFIDAETIFDPSYQMAEYANIWKNLIWNSNVKFFWKDKDGKIRGVSEAFLDFYGIESLDEVIGKTDAQMHWHVNGDKHLQDELDVIQKGKRLTHEPAEIIVKGVVHHIICDKMPIYQNGEIIGLVGYFADEEEVSLRFKESSFASRVDPVTGLMNVRAFLEALLDYAMEYRHNGQNYGLILFNNAKHDRIRETYGAEFAQRVMKKMADTIIQVTGQSCAAARTKESVFAVLTHLESGQLLYDLADEIKAKLSKINTVAGNPVTVRIESAVRLRSEEHIVDENIYEEALKELFGDF